MSGDQGRNVLPFATRGGGGGGVGGERPRSDGVAGRGGGGDNGGMDQRLAKLESEMQEVKGSLQRIEPAIARIDGFLHARLPELVTKADLSTEMKKIGDELGKKPDFGTVIAMMALLCAAILGTLALR